MCEKWDKGALNFTHTCPRYIYRNKLEKMAAYLGILEERAEFEGVELK